MATWNQVLSHSVAIKTFLFPTFRRVLEALRVKWWHSEMKILNIAFSEWESNPQL